VNRLTNRSRSNFLGKLTVSVAGSADRLAAEEAELVAQIAAGDSSEVGAAPGEQVKRYNKRLFAVGYRLLGNNSLVDEMVQETWVKV
jgi:hypothetical protein